MSQHLEIADRRLNGIYTERSDRYIGDFLVRDRISPVLVDYNSPLDNAIRLLYVLGLLRSETPQQPERTLYRSIVSLFELPNSPSQLDVYEIFLKMVQFHYIPSFDPSMYIDWIITSFQCVCNMLEIQDFPNPFSPRAKMMPEPLMPRYQSTFNYSILNRPIEKGSHPDSDDIRQIFEANMANVISYFTPYTMYDLNFHDALKSAYEMSSNRTVLASAYFVDDAGLPLADDSSNWEILINAFYLNPDRLSQQKLLELISVFRINENNRLNILRFMALFYELSENTPKSHLVEIAIDNAIKENKPFSNFLKIIEYLSQNPPTKVPGEIGLILNNGSLTFTKYFDNLEHSLHPLQTGLIVGSTNKTRNQFYRWLNLPETVLQIQNFRTRVQRLGLLSTAFLFTPLNSDQNIKSVIGGAFPEYNRYRESEKQRQEEAKRLQEQREAEEVEKLRVQREAEAERLRLLQENGQQIQGGGNEGDTSDDEVQGDQKDSNEIVQNKNGIRIESSLPSFDFVTWFKSPNS